MPEAGTIPDNKEPSARSRRRKDLYCEGTLKDDIAGLVAAERRRPFRDPRIKAFYIMGSGPGQGFAAELLEIDQRTVHGGHGRNIDEVLEPLANSTAVARQIPERTKVVRPVGHFAYVPECRWLVGPILSRLAGFPICDDPRGINRARVHDEVARDVVAFFNENLARAE